MQVVFRVDASLQIGIGHVMRCLTLADALKERDTQVSFISRKHKGHLNSLIKDKGYPVFELTETGKKNSIVQDQKTLFHADWLGVTQAHDAKECTFFLEKIKPDWLIVDHYAIDYRWQKELELYAQKLMVIDDLADRRHLCHILLDQTFGRERIAYESLIPKDCQLLLGSHYALLRPEFSRWRQFSLERRIKPQFSSLLITMGGVDADNVTAQVLEALKTCQLSNDVKITVIMGQTAPHLENVKQLAKSMPYLTDVKVNVNNMAELLANCDLAIGAAGATAWERCCLGVPSLTVLLADNQKTIFQGLDKQNITLNLRIDDPDFEKHLKKQIQKILEPDRMQQLSNKSSQIVNGLGADNVVQQLIQYHA